MLNPPIDGNRLPWLAGNDNVGRGLAVVTGTSLTVRSALEVGVEQPSNKALPKTATKQAIERKCMAITFFNLQLRQFLQHLVRCSDSARVHFVSPLGLDQGHQFFGHVDV